MSKSRPPEELRDIPSDLASAITSIAVLTAAGLDNRDHPAGGQAVIVPDGYRIEHLEPLQRPLPDQIVETVTFADLASLVAYVNDFKMPETRVFVQLPDIGGDRPTITAILDYHAAASHAVSRCSHRAVYAPELDPLWRAWSAIDGRPRAQLAFAEFLEEHVLEIIEPAGADVLETVANLKAKKKVDFESAIEQQTGAVKLTYHEEIQGRGKGEMQVPARLKLAMPIFFNGPVYEIDCLLRYRIDDGKLAFLVKIHCRELLLRDAMTEIVSSFREGAQLPVHFGSVG